MKKIVIVLAFLFASSCLMAQDAMEIKLRELGESYSQLMQISNFQKSKEFDAVHLLNQSEGVNVFINEKNNLFAWELTPFFYYNWHFDSLLNTAMLDYLPSIIILEKVPAFFFLWCTEPGFNLELYTLLIRTAAQALPRYKFKSISNNTFYDNIPGKEFIYNALFGGLPCTYYHQILFYKNNGITAFFITDSTLYEKQPSKVDSFKSILRLLDFGPSTQVLTKENSNNLKDFSMLQNYPNPFNATTSIPYSVNERSRVKLEIFNIKGALIKTVFDKIHEPGDYQIKIETDDLSSGLYLYRISNGRNSLAKKMILVK